MRGLLVLVTLALAMTGCRSMQKIRSADEARKKAEARAVVHKASHRQLEFEKNGRLYPYHGGLYLDRVMLYGVKGGCEMIMTSPPNGGKVETVFATIGARVRYERCHTVKIAPREGTDASVTPAVTYSHKTVAAGGKSYRRAVTEEFRFVPTGDDLLVLSSPDGFVLTICEDEFLLDDKYTPRILEFIKIKLDEEPGWVDRQSADEPPAAK